MIKEITCITCPKGCSISVEYDIVSDEGSNSIANCTASSNNGQKIIKSVTGYTCERGKNYATQEVLCPERILATTIKIEEGGLLPIRSRTAIPKEKMMQAMHEICASSIHAPVKMGDVVLADVASTGIDMIASCDAG